MFTLLHYISSEPAKCLQWTSNARAGEHREKWKILNDKGALLLNFAIYATQFANSKPLL